MTLADRIVFVTPSARAKYATKYPQTPADRMLVVENGYDEANFDAISGTPPPLAARPLVLLHSGIVYPEERDPTALFVALAALKRSNKIKKGDFVIRFRAPGHADLIGKLADEHQVREWIEIGNPLNYQAALREMLESDVLLLLQGRICNEQIPAKLYEYLRAGRPILGLADPEGDTGRKLRSVGVPFVAGLEDADAIAANLVALLDAVRLDRVALVPQDVVKQYSRTHLAGVLARILDGVVAGNATSARSANCRAGTSP
jgi:glycosyltransferase involved in cell wall biosynthesis